MFHVLLLRLTMERLQLAYDASTIVPGDFVFTDVTAEQAKKARG